MSVISAVLLTALTVPVPDLHWQGERHKLTEETPKGLDHSVVLAIASLSEWAVKERYQMHLLDDQSVLLLVHRGDKPAKLMKLIREAHAWLEETVPLPDKSHLRRTIQGTALAPEPVTLVQTRDVTDYHGLIDLLAEQHSYFRPNAERSKHANGLVMLQPFVGVWQKTSPGKWKPENEMLHRLARLWLNRCYERLPLWLETGFAWFTELELTGCVYAFPERDGFVWDTEHAGWESNLKTLYRTHKKQVPVPPEFPQRDFDAQHAAVAWGVVAYLVKHTDAWPEFLERVRVARHAGRKVTGTRWSLDPRYEVPLEEQRALLLELLGEDRLAAIQDFFKKGRKFEFKPKKK